MKKMITSGVLVLSILILSSTNVFAQLSPNVTTEYTVQQIDEMYQKHKMFNPQDTYPSQELQNKLLKDFPSAREIEWEKSDVLYEVEFEIGRFPSRDYKAYYDMTHKLIMYSEEISTKDVPAIVKNGALAKYPNFQFEEAEKVVKGKDTFYKVELEKGDYEVKLILDFNGVIVKEGIE